MTRLINQKQVTIVAKRITKEINSVGEMKFPNTIFLELGQGLPVLQLISKNPDQQLDPVRYAKFIDDWTALDLDSGLKENLDYQAQVELLATHLPDLERTLGMSIFANAAQLHPTIPVIARTFWYGLCYGEDGVAHREETIVLKTERPTRIYGECELTPGLIEAIDKGVIDPHFELPVLAGASADHKRAVMNILTPEQRAQAEELIKSRDASKGIDYSDCRTQEEAVAKFAGTFGLNTEQVTDAIGPIGFASDLNPAMFQRPAENGYWNGVYIPDTVEDPKAPEGYTHVIKTGKEHNLYPELKVKTSDTVEQLRKQCGMHHRQDFGDMNTFGVSMMSNGPVLHMASQGKHMGVCASNPEHARILLLGMTEDVLQKYVEKTNLTMKEMQWSIQLLRDNVIEVKSGFNDGRDGEPVYFLDIFDVESVSEHEMRKFQLMVSAQKTPEYKIEQMELNVQAHKLYNSEMNRLMFYAKDMEQEKILDELYQLIYHVNNLSNDQMVHFHIELGEGLIGEFESVVDRGSWETLKRMFKRARQDVITGIEAGQDVTQLVGASVNAYSLGEEPMDVSERVDIFLEHQHDAFFVIPLELWNGK